MTISPQFRRRVTLIASVLVFIAMSGCARFGANSFSAIEGSGVAKTEGRTVAAFSEIELGSAMKLHVLQGEKTSVEVTGDDNLVPLVQTTVSGEKLKVSFDGSYSTKLGIDVKITMPKITALSGSGAAGITATGVQGKSLKVQVTGASNATLSGKVEALEVECSGASRVLARELEAKTVRTDLSGASHAEVFASEQLEARATGASSVQYTGKPRQVLPHATGASSVKELAP
jgi:hypothetical protein